MTRPTAARRRRGNASNRGAPTTPTTSQAAAGKGKSGPRTPSPRPVRIGRLDTIGGVVRELGRLYRAARRGEITSAEAARLAYIATQIRAAIEVGDLERRLTELEEFRRESTEDTYREASSFH